MILKFRAWDKETQAMNGMAEIYRNKKQEIELHPRDGNIILMSFTGLVDKNGKDIFEGDIVSIDTDEFDLLVVKYEAGIYWLMDGEESMEYLSDYYNYVTVVGNIYENAEMVREVE